MMIKTLILPILCLLLYSAGLSWSQELSAPTMWSAKELKWSEIADLPGAKQTSLWNDPKTGESGVLLRWKFNTKVPNLVRTQDVRILVLTGTFTVQTNDIYREIGPGGFINIPKGVRHTLGCEASGECKFLMQHPGPVDVSQAKR